MPWLEHSVKCWIEVLRVDILVLFLILRGVFSISPSSMMLPVGFFRCPLSFYHETVLSFVKCFFCICWEDHMVYFLYSDNMIYYIDHIWWFVESSLHFWDKSHSWYKILYICCLLWFCWGLWCPYSQGILVYSFFVVFFPCDIFGFSKRSTGLRMSWEVFFYFFEAVMKDWY